MKKYALGIGAVILAIGLYSFIPQKEVPLKANASLYWFQVSTGQGANPSFLDNQVSLISGPSTIVPAGTNCTGTNNKCVVGFSQSQLVSPAYNHLDDNMGTTPQAPQAIGRQRFAL